MDIAELTKIIAEHQARDAELAQRQEASTSDRARFELERARRALGVLTDSKINGIFTRDLIGRARRETAGKQRAA